MEKANYKVSQLLSTKVESEDSVKLYFEGLGYQVFVNYVADIRNGRIGVNNNIRSLFRSYTSGYPDLLLRKDKEVSFVEVKLDGDNLRPNQVVFLNVLGKEEDVAVLYVNNINKELSVTNFTIDSTDVLRVDVRKRINSYKKLVKKRHYKPLWIIAALYKYYGDRILCDDILLEIVSRTSISKEKIIWFVDKVKDEEGSIDSMETDEIENSVTEAVVLKKAERDRMKKMKVLFRYGIDEFPDWAESLTLKEIILRLKDNKD